MTTQYMVTDDELKAVADAIRTKGGTQADLEWYSEFVSAIGAIPTGGTTPTGNINITDMQQTDVSAYATAQVVDADLVAGNVKKDVNILGVVGTYEGSGGGGASWELQTPANYDSTAGYPDNGPWQTSTTGNVRTDIYQVSKGKVYYFRTTDTVGNRYRVAFYTTNPVVSGIGANSVKIYNEISIVQANFALEYIAPQNGYIAINKDSAGTNNLIIEFYEINSPD